MPFFEVREFRRPPLIDSAFQSGHVIALCFRQPGEALQQGGH